MKCNCLTVAFLAAFMIGCRPNVIPVGEIASGSTNGSTFDVRLGGNKLWSVAVESEMTNMPLVSVKVVATNHSRADLNLVPMFEKRNKVLADGQDLVIYNGLLSDFLREGGYSMSCFSKQPTDVSLGFLFGTNVVFQGKIRIRATVLNMNVP